MIKRTTPRKQRLRNMITDIHFHSVLLYEVKPGWLSLKETWATIYVPVVVLYKIQEFFGRDWNLQF